jgi:phosphoglycerate dehydrogenase-like enzyme
MQRVLLHDQPDRRLAEALAGLATEGIAVTAVAQTDEAGFRTALPEAEIVWHVLKRLDAPVFAAAPRLRLVQKIGVGVNTIDLEAARRHGVAVCNMPGTNTVAVAELTLALMLACLRRLAWLDARVRAGGGWRIAPDALAGCGEIAGRTVGLVGYGAVPRRLVPVLLALGAEVRYWSRTRHHDALARWAELDELLAAADILSLHLPATPETVGLLDAAALARLKPGAILVNTARGELVDETALLAALEAGQLAAAGLDVFAAEPLPADHPLLGREDVVLVPHLAWRTAETLERSLAVAVENCRRLRAGRELLHRVA